MKRSDRRFGIEFEFSTELALVDRVLKKIIPRKEYLFEESYSSSDGKRWHMKKDGTTESELATPILTLKSAKISTLAACMHALEEAGVEVSKKDATHVHVDCCDVDPRAMLALWIKHERRIMALFPRHRRKNTYCELFGSLRGKISPVYDIFKKSKDVCRSHHSALSFRYFDERGTVEFRPMEGTLSFKEAISWANFCVRFAEVSQPVDTIDMLMEKQEFDDGDYAFMLNGNVEKWCQHRRSEYI